MMIVLHAGWSDGGLLLWGEASLDGAPQVRKRRGRKPKAPKPLPFPYDPDGEELLTALAGAVPGLAPAKRNLRQAAVWLPTRGGLPVPSSPLVGEPPSGSGEVGLASWLVGALPLSADLCLDLLADAVNRRTLAPGLVVGDDLAWWTRSLRFAGSLIARQRYLPDVVVEGDDYFARWTPVFVGRDAEMLSALCKTMPPSARCLSEPEATAQPSVPCRLVLQEFLGVVTDRLVRSAIASGSPAAPAGMKKSKGKTRRAGDFDSLHDQWMHALRSPEARLAGDEAELAGLVEQVRSWRRPLAATAASPFRLCLRLEEPAAEDELPFEEERDARSWYVRYLLQAADDPSLIVPVVDAWCARGKKAAVFKGKGKNFKAAEYVLGSLGQASGICPRIENSLKAAEPAGYPLDAAGAHEFLTERAVSLEQAGFGVMLPAWWTRKGIKRRLSVQAKVRSPKMQGGSGLSLESIVKFEWETSLGGEKLSLEELKALAKLKAPLVKIRGQWVEVNADEIRAALDFWKKKGSASAGEIVRMALGAEPAVEGLEFAGVKASGWIGELLERLEGRASFEELPPPRGFAGTLRPYQERGYSWLAFLKEWGLGACLADDMGLGKTIQTLALVQRDREANGGRPALLVCPTSVANNWKKEAERFTPELPVMIHHGVGRTKGAKFRREAERHALVVSTYALLNRDLEHFKSVEWAGVVLDEAQNVKNPETKQSKAARSIAADYRIALTGTPVENNVGDLWAIMEFLNPGFLGSQAAFRRSFFLPIQARGDAEAAERLKRLTGPFILRRLKTDKSIIADLPEKQETKVWCNLTKEQASLYAAVLKDLEENIESAEGIGRKGLILGTLSKLKQVCNHPAQFLGDNSSIPGRSGKLERLAALIEELLEAGDRALVFSQFAEMGGILQKHLQETFGREALFLHGGTPRKRRDEMVERFNSPEGTPVFILSLKAGGTGLNLTGASHVFHFDRWWNPAVENQATDRAYRIGQTRKVQVHKFVCVGTLEEKIDEMIERKKEIAEQVVGAGEGWLTEMSNEELRETFALRKEAVEA